MAQSLTANRTAGWFRQAPWRALVVGGALALSVAALLMRALMNASLADITALVTTLGITSVLSLGLSYILYRQGWARFSSITLTLALTYIWAALLTLFNVWVMQRQMFVSSHDLLLSGVLLSFAAIMAMSFGVFVAASLTDGLRDLAESAGQVAAGDLSARVTVSGRDEVARVALSFNAMAAQLEQAAAHRDRLDKLRRDLIAWASHDLRTPITSMRVRVEALLDGMVTEEETANRFYESIHRDILELNDLIDDLFELAQLDAEELVFEVVPSSLGDIISDALESFTALAEQRGIELTGDITDDVDPVYLNPQKINRVLSNLIGNALRYTPTGGKIRVSARRTAEGAEVTVRDGGPGFDPGDLPRVFEQFYRGEQARSRATGGAGLGLAIARGIVRAHGGRIWAENVADETNGRGALVGFTLPDH